MSNCSTEGRVSYELFLPRVIAAIQGKVKKDEQLSEPETRAIVAEEFRAAVREVAKLTNNLTVEVPIHVYPDSRIYPVEVPSEFSFRKIMEPIIVDKYELPKRTSINGNVIELPCCPSKQVNNAYYARVAVLPKMSCDNCSFDEAFVEEHYDMIHAQLMSNLLGQPARQWRALGQSDKWQMKVTKALKDWKTSEFGSRPIRIKKRNLTDGIYTKTNCG